MSLKAAIAAVLAAGALAAAGCGDEPGGGATAPPAVRPLAELAAAPPTATALTAECEPFVLTTLAPTIQLRGVVAGLYSICSRGSSESGSLRLVLRDNVTDAERDDLLAILGRLPEVRSYEYVSQEEALMDVRERVDPEVLRELDLADDLLPATVTVETQGPDQARAVREVIQDHSALDPADPVMGGTPGVPERGPLRMLSLLEFEDEAAAQAWLDETEITARRVEPAGAVPEGAVCVEAEAGAGAGAGAAQCFLRRGRIVLSSEATVQGRADFAAEQGLVFLEDWLSDP